MKASQSRVGLPEGFSGTWPYQEGKAALMVGTIEPRKGYGQILYAFEHLWAEGNTIGSLSWVDRAG